MRLKWDWIQRLWPLGILVTVAVAIAAVPGIFSSVNSVNGYQLNGVAVNGDALCGSGTGFYDTPCGVGGFFYQTLELNGTSETQRPAVNFSALFTATDSSSPARTNVGLNAPGNGGFVATEASSPSTSLQPAYYDGNGNLVPHVTQVINCLASSCIGGSTYSSGVSFTNASGRAVTEEITMCGPGGGGAGDNYEMTSSIGSLTGPSAWVTNSEAGCNSITFTVPTGVSFSATAVTASGGGTPTISNWLEVQ